MTDVYERITGYPAEKIIVLDAETTGFSCYTDDVLSVSICDVNGGPILDTLVKPERKLAWPDAQAVNGISPAMVANAPSKSEVSDMLKGFFDGGTLVVGYNVSFDMGFMRECFGAPWGVPTFDVKDEFAKVHGAGWMNGRYKWSKLVECAAFYGFDHADAHASMSDAVATAWCFRSLLMDSDYRAKRASDMADRHGRFTLAQTNSTREGLRSVLGGMKSGECDAVLRIGQMTRGKNKGKPRYECMVGDVCIGTLRFGAENDVKIALGMSPDDGMPDSVKVRAFASIADENERCDVTVSPENVIDDLCASDIGAEYGSPGIYRRIDEPKAATLPDHARPVAIPSSNARPSETEPKANPKRVAIVIIALVLIVLAIVGIINLASSFIIPAIVIIAVFIVAIAYANKGR